MKVVLIEDEQLLADDLKRLLRALRPDWQIVKCLSSVQEGLDFFKQDPDYQLIFSDIQLSDGLSFEIFRQVEPKAPVIFCTAYDQYALEAFKNNGIDYVLKPFDTESILKAILHVEHLGEQLNRSNMEKLLSELHEPKPETDSGSSLLIRYQDKIIPIRFSAIALVYVSEGQVKILDLNGKNYALSQSMEELEQQLGKNFYRIDRQHLVNRAVIQDVSQYFDRKLLLNLTINYPEKLLIRKEKTSHFLQWLSHTS